MRHVSVALLLCLVCGCSRPPAPEYVPAPEPVSGDVPVETTPEPNLAAPPARDDLADIPPLTLLSVRDKVAQLIIPWISGEYWASDDSLMNEAMRLVTEEHVGGFVVGLGGTGLDLASKFNALQRASRLPLFIAADLESGPSMRVRGATAFPGNMAVGAAGREQDAYDVGTVIAQEARAIGINWIFAPVVDVNNNPANPIINVRSYGEDPARVGALGAMFVRGLREHGVLATAKHFPGHGDVSLDSHLEAPVVAASRGRLDSVELAPFRRAVQAGVDAVMTAHVIMPTISGTLPATLSPAALDTLLRQQLGFTGIVVTDALDMSGVLGRLTVGQASIMALKAGADVLLMPLDVRAAIDAVTDAVVRGEITEARLDSSVSKLLWAKARLGLFQRRAADLDAIPGIVGIRAHEQVARDIAARAVVLVKDSLGLVPLNAERRQRVLVLSYGNEAELDVGGHFSSALRAGGARIQRMRLWPASGPASYDSARTFAASASAVIVLVSARPLDRRPDNVNMPFALAQLVDELARANYPLLTVSLGSPYLLNQVPMTPGYLVAWSSSEVAERAAAAAVLGTAEITGRLPVSLPPYVPLGSGLTRVAVRAASPGGPE